MPNENSERAIEYEMENPVQNSINKFKNLPSIKIILKINPCNRFSLFPSFKR